MTSRKMLNARNSATCFFVVSYSLNLLGCGLLQSDPGDSDSSGGSPATAGDGGKPSDHVGSGGIVPEDEVEPCAETSLSAPPSTTELTLRYTDDPLPEAVGGDIPVPSSFQLADYWNRDQHPGYSSRSRRALRFTSDERVEQFIYGEGTYYKWSISPDHPWIQMTSCRSTGGGIFAYTFSSGTLTMFEIDSITLEPKPNTNVYVYQQL